MNKITAILVAASMMVCGSAMAIGSDDIDNGYASHLGQQEQHTETVEFVYLNSPYEYEGPGKIKSCEKVSTYQGGPKTGSWVTYYMCEVSYK